MSPLSWLRRALQKQQTDRRTAPEKEQYYRLRYPQTFWVRQPLIYHRNFLVGKQCTLVIIKYQFVFSVILLTF